MTLLRIYNDRRRDPALNWWEIAPPAPPSSSARMTDQEACQAGGCRRITGNC